jgi:ketosteroid isomerase-like protein
MASNSAQMIRNLFAAFSRGDAQAVQDLWTVDAQWHPAYLGGGRVEGTVFEGHAGLSTFVTSQAETWKSMLATPLEIREVADHMLVKVRLEGVGRSSGLAVDRVTWNVFELRGDKVATGRVYDTEQDALAAIGVNPPASEPTQRPSEGHLDESPTRL